MDAAQTLSKQEIKALAADVIRLSHLLTRERASLPSAYLKDEGLRKAYCAYFLFPNLRKIQIVLRELALHSGKLLVKEKLRVLDLGAGPGTSLLGVLEFFGAQEKKPILACVAVDQVAENLDVAQELFLSYRNASAVNASLKTIRSPVETAAQLVPGPFELVILSNVLNELFVHEGRKTQKRLVVLEDIMNQLLADDGTCIIIEPALRQTSREMLEVRDGLLNQGFTIFAPCLFSKKCPALLNPKDWCHEDICWDPPALVRELDDLTGLRKDSLKFSYLVLRKDSLSLADLYGENAFRVVSEPLVSKGKMEFFLCGTSGRRLVTRLDKDRTARNDSFGKLRRGDVVGFEGLFDQEKRYKVGKETTVFIRS